MVKLSSDPQFAEKLRDIVARPSAASSDPSTSSRPPSTAFVTETNADPKAFFWTDDPGSVPAAAKRGKQALGSVL
jgi:hypothetical protein